MTPTDPVPPRPHLHTPTPTTLDLPWAYPDVPPGLAAGASAIRTTSRFAAKALGRAGLVAEIVVVPPPICLADRVRPDWEPGRAWALDCRHLVWGGPPSRVEPPTDAAPPRRKRFGRRVLGRAFHKISPRLSPETIHKVARVQAIAARLAARPSPKALAVALARAVYWRYVRRWLNPEAIARIGEAKRRSRARAAAAEPPPPLAPLELSGLVYAALLDPLDPAANLDDLLTAFLLAFRDRAEVTLVVELASDASQRPAALARLRDAYLGYRLAGHHCRLVVIADDLDANQTENLRRATTFAVSASRAEASSRPYYPGALAAGRPLLAPNHTGFADLVDASTGFPLRSTPEPAPWPSDPSGPLATTWHRLTWADLREAFQASAAVAVDDPARYRELAASGRRRVAEQSDATEGLSVGR